MCRVCRSVHAQFCAYHAPTKHQPRHSLTFRVLALGGVWVVWRAREHKEPFQMNVTLLICARTLLGRCSTNHSGLTEGHVKAIRH